MSTEIQKYDPFDPRNNADHIERPHISTIKLETKSGTYDFEGDDIPKKTFDAVIVDDSRTRVYYSKPMGEGEAGARPDCSSKDGKVPIADAPDKQAEACATCPMNQWGTDIKGGKGKACREKRILFVLQPGQMFVSKLMLPTTSIGPVDRYYSQLLQKNKSFRGVVTRFSAVKDEKSATKHSRAVLQAVTDLTPEEKDTFIKNVFPTWERMKPFILGSEAGETQAAGAPGDAVDSEEVPF